MIEFGIFRNNFYPDSLIDKVKDEVRGKNKSQTWAILAKYFVWKEVENSWNEEEAQTRRVEKEYRLVGIKRGVKREELKLEKLPMASKSTFREDES